MRFIALATLSTFWLGCSVIVGGDPPEAVPCEVADGGVDPCSRVQPNFLCISGFCSSPECQSRESCDGEDNDCDGAVDEDLDNDGDSFSWCPTGPPPQDCDDSNADVHPARGGETPPSEMCDGLDNDCNTTTIDGSTECDASEVCTPPGGCVEINCGNRPSLCADDQFCDSATTPPMCRPSDTSCLNPLNPCGLGERCNPNTGICVTPVANGSFCDFDAECMSDLCVPLAAPGIPPSMAGPQSGVCANTCCSDDLCGAGELCWASGSGTAVCLPTTLFSGSTYGAPANSACAGAATCPDECILVEDSAYEVSGRQSLMCGPNGREPTICFVEVLGPLILDNCIDDDDGFCINSTCTLQQCAAGNECATGICLGGRCRDTCGETQDCGAYPSLRPYCSFRDIVDGGQESVVPVCVYAATGTGATGESCTDNDQCRDQTCVDDTGNPLPPDTTTPRRCADTCCNSSQCIPGQHCRPTFVRGAWEMHCLPQPMF